MIENVLVQFDLWTRTQFPNSCLSETISLAGKLKMKQLLCMIYRFRTESSAVAVGVARDRPRWMTNSLYVGVGSDPIFELFDATYLLGQSGESRGWLVKASWFTCFSRYRGNPWGVWTKMNWKLESTSDVQEFAGMAASWKHFQVTVFVTFWYSCTNCR